MKRFAFLLAVAFVLSSGLVSATNAQAESVVIGSYNVENFFDIWNDPYTEDGDPKPVEETGPLGQAVQAIDADILGICEVENGQVLQRLVQDHFPDNGYQHIFTQPTNSGRGIHLGLMSRYPVTAVTSYRFNTLTLPGKTQTWQWARDLMHAVVDVNGQPVHVMEAHFKSKRDSQGDPESATWRLAEATFARKVVADVLKDDPNALIVLMGDLNDTIDSPTLQCLLADNLLVDAHRSLPNNTITYLRAPYLSKIDFMLLSPAMAKLQTGAHVLTGDVILQGSDHAPVSAVFDIPKVGK